MNTRPEVFSVVRVAVACVLAIPLACSSVEAREEPRASFEIGPDGAPRAKKVPVARTIHGDTFVDDYSWLRAKGTPDVESYLYAENAYADRVLAPLAPAISALEKELISHVQEDDESVPERDGAFTYWYRMVKGKDYAIHLRRALVEGAQEEIILDENELAKGHEHFSVGHIEVSDDGRFLLFTTDTLGFREYTLRVKDLTTGAMLPLEIPRVVTTTWAADNQTIFYTLEDAAKRSATLHRHTLGKPVTEDVLLYTEDDARFSVWIWRSSSRAFVLVNSVSATSSEVRLIDAKAPLSPLVLVDARRENVEYYVADRGPTLVIRTNDTGRNFRLVEAPLATPGREHWREVRAHSDSVLLEDTTVLASYTILSVRDGGLPHLEVLDEKSQLLRRVQMPEPIYAAHDLGNPEYKATTARFAYESLTTPDSVYEHDLASGVVTLLKQQVVPGGFDRARYRTEALRATAKDGARIPMSLVSLKETPRDGTGAVHLTGYAAYGYSFPVSFSSTRLPLLDRGVAVAICHARGGSELGKRWHDDGRMQYKMNTFTDFVACAEHLIAMGYASRERLSIEGGSAGGLLMGAVLNMRPELFRAAIVDVPFVDVINTMLDDTLPLTIGEYEEWGNPNIAEQYAWMRAYSPYDNVAARDYPSMLVRTSYHDSQVMYFEPAKYVARLRALKTDTNPLLFKIHMEPAGHGGKSGRYAALADVAIDHAYILSELAPTTLPR
jgi:oligopeptidase B